MIDLIDCDKFLNINNVIIISVLYIMQKNKSTQYNTMLMLHI